MFLPRSFRSALFKKGPLPTPPPPMLHHSERATIAFKTGKDGNAIKQYVCFASTASHHPCLVFTSKGRQKLTNSAVEHFIGTSYFSFHLTQPSGPFKDSCKSTLVADGWAECPGPGPFLENTMPFPLADNDNAPSSMRGLVGPGPLLLYISHYQILTYVSQVSFTINVIF